MSDSNNSNLSYMEKINLCLDDIKAFGFETAHFSLIQYYSSCKDSIRKPSVIILVDTNCDFSIEEEEKNICSRIADDLGEKIQISFSKRDPVTDQSIKETRRVIVGIVEDAGLGAIYVQQIDNEYWGPRDVYGIKSPWFKITCKYGHLKIGFRKNVINIDWSECPEFVTIVKQKEIFTSFEEKHEATCGDTFIHAWSVESAVEYLQMLIKAVEENNKGK